MSWYTCTLCEMFEGIRYHKSTAPHTAVTFTFFSTFLGLSSPVPCQLFVALKIACCSRKFNKVSQVVIRDAWSSPKIPSSYRYTFATLHHIIVEDVRSVDSHMMTIFVKWNEISSYLSLTHTATRDVTFLVILEMYKRRKDKRICVWLFMKKATWGNSEWEKSSSTFLHFILLCYSSSFVAPVRNSSAFIFFVIFSKREAQQRATSGARRMSHTYIKRN